MAVPFYKDRFEVTSARVHFAPESVLLSEDSTGFEVSMQIDLPPEPPTKGYYMAVQIVRDRRSGWKRRLFGLVTFHASGDGWSIRLSHYILAGSKPEHVYEDLDIRGSKFNLLVKVTKNGVTATVFDEVDGFEVVKLSALYSATQIQGKRFFLLFGNPHDEDKNSIVWPVGVRYAHLQLEVLREGDEYVGPRFRHQTHLPPPIEVPGEIDGYPVLRVRDEVVLAGGALAAGKDPEDAAVIAVRTMNHLDKSVRSVPSSSPLPAAEKFPPSLLAVPDISRLTGLYHFVAEEVIRIWDETLHPLYKSRSAFMPVRLMEVMEKEDLYGSPEEYLRAASMRMLDDVIVDLQNVRVQRVPSGDGSDEYILRGVGTVARLAYLQLNLSQESLAEFYKESVQT